MKLLKKTVALLLVALMTMALFVGCAKDKAENLDQTEVVMVVGDTEVTMNVANFFVRYNQSMMEAMYTQYMGEDVWMQKVDKGVTYEDSVKESLLKELQKMYIVANHVADYSVELTEDEVKAIEAAADAFIAENKEEATQAKVSADKDTVIAYLKLHTINEKMAKAMKDDVDKTVTDEQAAQKRMRYLEIKKVETLDDGSTMQMTEDEIKAAQKEAKDFLKAAKENGSMEAYSTEAKKETKTLAFDAESTALEADVIKAADKLKENEFSKVIETETGIYVVQLESEFDATATESNKANVLAKRQEARYQELVEKWTEDAKITVHEKVWDKISIQGLKVNNVEDPKEETEDTTQKGTEDATLEVAE